MSTRYTATVEGQSYEIILHADGTVEIDGRQVQVDMQHIVGNQVWSLLINNQSYEVYGESIEGQWRVLVDGERHEVDVEDERLRRLRALGGPTQGPVGDLAIKAPMPGLIVKIPVSEGQEVSANQAVLILEAMKMENELRAPRAGIVKSIKAQIGTPVDQGAVLLIIGELESQP
jgi:biotin carboxyl carrier protein